MREALLTLSPPFLIWYFWTKLLCSVFVDLGLSSLDFFITQIACFEKMSDEAVDVTNLLNACAHKIHIGSVPEKVLIIN